MLRQLTVDEIVQVLKTTPEQRTFDWKSDLNLNTDNAKRSELVKDVVAIANATTTSPGFVFYGVDPRRPEPIVGISESFDDARFQQLLQGKVDPQVVFVYYEVSYGPQNIGVVHVPPSVRRPHIITVDFGVLRDGQIPIRRGSATEGIRFQDLIECFYGQTSPYFVSVLQKTGALAADMNARTRYMQELREQAEQAVRDMEILSRQPPGSLGGRW